MEATRDLSPSHSDRFRSQSCCRGIRYAVMQDQFVNTIGSQVGSPSGELLFFCLVTEHKNKSLTASTSCQLIALGLPPICQLLPAAVPCYCGCCCCCCWSYLVEDCPIMGLSPSASVPHYYLSRESPQALRRSGGN